MPENSSKDNPPLPGPEPGVPPPVPPAIPVVPLPPKPVAKIVVPAPQFTIPIPGQAAPPSQVPKATMRIKPLDAANVAKITLPGSPVSPTVPPPVIPPAAVVPSPVVPVAPVAQPPPLPPPPAPVGPPPSVASASTVTGPPVVLPPAPSGPMKIQMLDKTPAPLLSRTKAAKDKEAATPPPVTGKPPESPAVPAQPASPAPSTPSFAHMEMLDKTPAPLLSRQKAQPSEVVQKAAMTPLPASVPPVGAPASKTASPVMPVVPPSQPPPPVVIPVLPEAKLPVSESLPEPAAEKKSKLPMSLLSRRKTRPPVELTDVPAATVKKGGTPWWAHVLIRLLFVITALGLGYGSYYYFRQTRFELFVIGSPGFELQGDATIVREFTEDMKALRDDLILARAPLMDRVQERQQLLSRVRSDVAGLEERIRLLDRERQEIRDQIESVLKISRQKAQQLLDADDSRLEKEYADRMSAFGKAIEDRVKSLGLTYTKTSDFDAPEVWTNAFRLSLYDAPKGVKTGGEREWAEKQLAAWREFEADWEKRKAALKDRTQDLKADAGTKITQFKNRLVDLDQRSEEARIEIEPLKKELEDYEKSYTEAVEASGSLETPFYLQMLDIPVKTVEKRLPYSPPGRVSWQHLELDTKYQPGEYWLWLRAMKNGDECWALVKFKIEPFAETRVTVYESAFVSVKSYLHAIPDVAPGAP